jgi:hypothetical protein
MTAATVPSASSAPIRVKSGVVKVPGNKGSIKKISRNGVYMPVEVQHPDGSRSRFRVPSRLVCDRIAKETADARTKTMAQEQ